MMDYLVIKYSLSVRLACLRVEEKKIELISDSKKYKRVCVSGSLQSKAVDVKKSYSF